MDTTEQTIATLVIYRLANVKALTKAQKADIDRNMATARVTRDDIVNLFVSGDFKLLPILPVEYRNAPKLRRHDGVAKSHGYIVPLRNLGRPGTANVEQSVRLWIVKNLGIDPSAFQTSLESVPAHLVDMD